MWIDATVAGLMLLRTRKAILCCGRFYFRLFEHESFKEQMKCQKERAYIDSFQAAIKSIFQGRGISQ